MKQLVITKKEEGIRLSKYIKKYFDVMPESLIHKLLRKKYFEINDKKAKGDETLNAGDKISIFIGDDTYNKYHTSKKVVKSQSIIDKSVLDNIIYEDENVILYNKPQGMLSQNASPTDISVNAILNEYVDNKNDIFTPSIVNRLDRNTSGIIIFAKTNVAARAISKMIRDGKLEKRYKARVNGILKNDEDILNNLYKKDETKNIANIKAYDGKTVDGYSLVSLKYRVIKRYVDTTELDIDLITGKSHQIRAQLAHIGHPIVCDRKYMDKALYEKNVSAFKERSQILRCYKIRFSSFDEETLKNLSNKTFKI